MFQWLFDEAQIDADNVGAPVTKQQWDYVHKMGDALRHSFENVSSVFAPSCLSHAILTKKDWLNVKIDDISIVDALHCWEQKINKRRQRKLKQIGKFSDRLITKRNKKHSGNGLNVNGGKINIPRIKKRRNRKRKVHRRHKGMLIKCFCYTNFAYTLFGPFRLN